MHPGVAMAEILYFTELQGLPVLDVRGRRIGRVRDAQIASISLQGIRLADEQLTPYHSDEYMLRIGRDLLDQQIIDVNGRKVVRVNDVTFEHRAEADRDLLNVLEVDIGIRSILR